ncbi:MAG: HPP family protein [Pseudomonadota bacterium]
MTALAARSGLMLLAVMGAAWWSGATAMAAPFSATCVLLALLPGAPFSAPRTVLLAHVLCLAAGAMGMVLPLPPLAAALVAAWLALLAMARLRAVHAPAVAHAVILSLGAQHGAAYLASALGVAGGFALLAWLEA